MLNKAKIFQQKMIFIKEKVCNDDLDEFTKLFWIKEKTDFENRRYNLNKNLGNFHIILSNNQDGFSKKSRLCLQ